MGRSRRVIIVDAGPLYAYVDADDEFHAASAALLTSYPGVLVVPTLVITEVVYLIGTRLGAAAEVRFLGDLATGAFDIDPVHPADWLHIADLVARYRDFPLGTVDASVVACAGRRGSTVIATTDRRHFSVVRPRSGTAFTLLP
ncbi:MAG: type II toxin-antitoxin system VapC family toxin [Mycobacteriales bacterium]